MPQDQATAASAGAPAGAGASRFLPDATVEQATRMVFSMRFHDAAALLAPTRMHNVWHALTHGEALAVHGFVSEDAAVLAAAADGLKLVHTVAKTAAVGAGGSASLAEQAVLALACAEASVFHAGVLARRGSYLRAAGTLKSAWSQFQQTQRQADALTRLACADVQARCAFLSGVFRFCTSLSPAWAWELLRFIGFQVDRKQGLQDLKQCSETEAVGRSATGHLLMQWIHLFFLGDIRAAEAMLEQHLAVYPESGLALYLGGYASRKQGRPVAAIERFQQVQQIAQQRFPVLANDALYEEASLHAEMGNAELAASQLAAFLAKHQGTSFRAYCAFQLGMCLDMLGRREEAIASYRKVPGYVRKHFTFDRYAARKAREFADQPPSAGALAVFQAEQRVNVRQLDAASTLLASAAATGQRDAVATDADAAAMYWFVVGKLRAAQQDEPSAAAAFRRVIALASAVKHDVYVLPYAMVFLAEIEVRADAWVSAGRLLAQAQHYRNYDFDKPLHRRLVRLSDEVKAHGVAVGNDTCCIS